MQTDRNPYEVIGHLVVADEHGVEHLVKIRREDLTTTNGAYRAIADEIRDALRTVLHTNRSWA